MAERESRPTEEVRRLYEESESRTATAFEGVVSTGGFGELLARLTENVVAITKLGTDALDLVVRNLRLAGRTDITRLARELARTEDKLEMVLQELERVSQKLDADRGGAVAELNGVPGEGAGAAGEPGNGLAASTGSDVERPERR